MRNITKIGPIEVGVDIVLTPTDEAAMLLQLPDGFVLIPRPEQARALGQSIIEAADELEERRRPLQN